MTRREAYDVIIARMHKPENRARYDAFCKNVDKKDDDALIEMHLKHIRDYLATLDQQYDDFIANSCNAALRALFDLLDKNGWF